MATRRTYVFANWKMSLLRADAVRLAESIVSSEWAQDESLEIALFASHPHLDAVGRCLRATRCALGAQDVAAQAPGAFTGAVSAEQLQELGVRWALLGHSERRHIFGEDDQTVAAKLRTCLDRGLAPLLCLGETLEQREAGRTEAVVLSQLASALDEWSSADLADLALAYEPVWAIGTGHNADPQEAQRVHAILREQLVERFGAEFASTVPILYGGSVKAESAAAYFACEAVDGALIGGASLQIASFLAILGQAAR